MFYMYTVCIALLIHGSVGYYQEDVNESPDSDVWTGRWFPEPPSTTPSPDNVDGDFKNRRRMGVKDFCDDGKTHLEVDFDGDFRRYVCLNPRNRIETDPLLPPVIHYENIPRAYEAYHICMNESIKYPSEVPTFGPHRQLWPKFGDYTYLPVQRWIHIAEHGGIIALYHPCADPQGIRLLKKLVSNCLLRHVITPLETLPVERPFALVTWGVRLLMPEVNPYAVREFILQNALRGPEHVSEDGQFEQLLISQAEIVSDQEDSQLCPRPDAHE